MAYFLRLALAISVDRRVRYTYLVSMRFLGSVIIVCELKGLLELLRRLLATVVEWLQEQKTSSERNSNEKCYKIIILTRREDKPL